MHSLLVLLFATTRFSAVVGAPADVPITLDDRTSRLSTFTVTQIQNPKYNKTTSSWGPAAYEYALAKHSSRLNIGVSILTAAAGVKGSVAANPAYAYYDREYVSPVQIGTPAQTLPLDFDTGSADLWVFSSDTPLASVTTGKATYKTTKSSTAKAIKGSTWAITYGDGSSSSGVVYTDVVTIGGLSVKAQYVESATKVSTSFAVDTSLSGLMGFSFSSANQIKPGPQKTWFDNIKSTLALPLFTANLKKSAPGTYNFGYIDTTQYIGALTYAPVTTRYSLWEFSSAGYAIGTGAKVATVIDAVADTGTSLLLLPSTIVAAYYSKLAGSYFDNTYGAYLYPCANIPPAFSFYVGTAKQTIPGSYINYGQVTLKICYGGIQSQGTLPFSLFGDIALKAQFVVFDSSIPRIGWANKGAV